MPWFVIRHSIQSTGSEVDITPGDTPDDNNLSPSPTMMSMQPSMTSSYALENVWKAHVNKVCVIQ